MSPQHEHDGNQHPERDDHKRDKQCSPRIDRRIARIPEILSLAFHLGKHRQRRMLRRQTILGQIFQPDVQDLMAHLALV